MLIRCSQHQPAAPVSAPRTWRASDPTDDHRRASLRAASDRADGPGSAIELYEKVGFEIEGRQRDAVQVDGVYENIICMALLFY
jgi:ribosomal protein S18 acetylase RimI-like enzyme